MSGRGGDTIKCPLRHTVSVCLVSRPVSRSFRGQLRLVGEQVTDQRRLARLEFFLRLLCQSWTSSEGLSELEELRPTLDEWQRGIDADARGEDFAQRLEAWWERNDPGTAEKSWRADCDDTAWTP